MGKYGPEKTPYLDVFHAVKIFKHRPTFHFAYDTSLKKFIHAINKVLKNSFKAIFTMTFTTISCH